MLQVDKLEQSDQVRTEIEETNNSKPIDFSGTKNIYKMKRIILTNLI